MEKYYTPQEIADNLKLNINTIYQYIRENKLKAVKIGNRYRISENDLKEFLDRSKEGSIED